MASKKMLVKDIMTKEVITAKPEQLIRDIAQMLLCKRITGVPILDDAGKLVGIVTATDLFNVLGDRTLDRMFGDYNHLFKNMVVTVSEVMITNVTTFTPDTPMDLLISTSVRKGIHTFPILEKGKLVGIVGKRDILHAGFSSGCCGV